MGTECIISIQSRNVGDSMVHDARVYPSIPNNIVASYLQAFVTTITLCIHEIIGYIVTEFLR